MRVLARIENETKLSKITEETSCKNTSSEYTSQSHHFFQSAGIKPIQLSASNQMPTAPVLEDSTLDKHIKIAYTVPWSNILRPRELETPETVKENHKQYKRQILGTHTTTTRRYTDLSQMTSEERQTYKRNEAARRKRESRAIAKL